MLVHVNTYQRKKEKNRFSASKYHCFGFILLHLSFRYSGGKDFND
jgi:hypothetical protein